MEAGHTTTEGAIAAIRGGIVDVVFAGTPPRIDELLMAGDVPLLVMTFVEGGRARCIALGAVHGLGLGAAVRTTGGPMRVPVGKAVLGRMLDVFGAPLDGLPPPEAADRRPVHRAPPPSPIAPPAPRCWRPESRPSTCSPPSSAAARPASSAARAWA